MKDSPLEEWVNLADAEERARAILPRDVYDYFAGAACDQVTVRANRRAFAETPLYPRVLRGAPDRDLSTGVLGQRLEFPLLIAPTAMQKLAHPEGELAIARAAHAANIPNVLSTWSTTLLEDVAAACPGRLWMQLYFYKDRGVTRSLVERAQAAGCQGIELTVDTPMPGKREADLRNRFRMPSHLRLVNLEASGLGSADEGSDKGLGLYVHQRMDPALCWKDVEWLRGITTMPVLLKGILRADDARRALDHGAAGVVVSNHGGRQLDTAPATLTALPAVVRAMGQRGVVLLDGGVRRGTDLLKTIALGAHAVQIGRPVLWGLAAGGEEGVRAILDLLRAEFDLAMALAGCANVSEITRDLVDPPSD